MTEDGEKPWRDREQEFAARVVTRETLLAQWSSGWSALHEAVDAPTDADLRRTISIRKQPMAVHEALHPSLAHAAELRAAGNRSPVEPAAPTSAS